MTPTQLVAWMFILFVSTIGVVCGVIILGGIVLAFIEALFDVRF